MVSYVYIYIYILLYYIYNHCSIKPTQWLFKLIFGYLWISLIPIDTCPAHWFISLQLEIPSWGLRDSVWQRPTLPGSQGMPRGCSPSGPAVTRCDLICDLRRSRRMKWNMPDWRHGVCFCVFCELLNTEVIWGHCTFLSGMIKYL